jgi:adenine-specific DNA-methyltransferase
MVEHVNRTVHVIKQGSGPLPRLLPDYLIWLGDVQAFLAQLPEYPIFDLIVTSPPYNLGKEYEKKVALEHYLEWQKKIIQALVLRLKETGSVCWQLFNP